MNEKKIMQLNIQKNNKNKDQFVIGVCGVVGWGFVYCMIIYICIYLYMIYIGYKFDYMYIWELGMFGGRLGLSNLDYFVICV